MLLIDVKLNHTYTSEKFDFVYGRFCVMLGTFHNLHCHKSFAPENTQCNNMLQ